MNAVSAGTEPLAVDVDDDGHLRHLADWNPAVATALAARQGLVLTDEHWAVLHAIRDFYRQYQRSPTTRVLLKYLGQQLGADYASSIHIMALFGDGTPARTVARLAGLPKPANCI